MPQSQLPARQIDIHNPEHVKKIILEIDSEQNRRRKRKAWRAFQCKNDNQKEYVKQELAVLYPKTHKNFRVGNIKVAKKIVEKVSKAYKQVPSRVLENETETETLTEMYNDYNFHRSFKEADELFVLHKYVCMWLDWQNPSEAEDKHEIPVEEGNYVLHALAPYEYDLVRDQVTGEPLIFILSYPESTITNLAGRSDGIEQTISESQSDTSAQTMLYKLWSPDKYSECMVKRTKGHGNADGDDITVDIPYKADNILERLPISYLQADTAVDYPVASDLAEQSVDWNVSFSDLKTAASTQGHGQLVITHPEGQKMKQAHMGMHTALSLPQSNKPDRADTDAKYIGANPDLTGQLDVLKFDLMNILDDEGIKAKGSLEGGVEKFASGFDRLISEADVQDRIEDNQALYKDSLEQGVYLNLKAYEEAMSQNTFKSESVTTHFEKPKVLISDKETLENIEKREELGTLLPYEKHMILNPNLTVEQAKEREEEIQKALKEKMKNMQEVMGMNDEEGEDDDPEEIEEDENEEEV